MRQKSYPRGCPLLRLLPELVLLYERLDHPRGRVEFGEFEDNLCKECVHQPLEGHCALRKMIDCDLQRSLIYAA